MIPVVIAVLLLGSGVPNILLSQEEEPQAPLSPETGVASSDERWLIVENITADSIVMLQEAFVDQAALLRDAAQTFAASPSLETLAAFQETWRQTTSAWYRADIVGYDQSAVWRNQISKTPVNVEFVEGFIADIDAIDQTFVSAVGSTSKGLPVIEYLIFSETGNQQAALDSLTTGDRAAQRMQYAVAAAEDVYSVAQAYFSGWDAMRQAYLADPFDPNEGLLIEQMSRVREMELRDLTNKLIDTIENIVTMKLGYALGTSSGGNARPDLVEFTRADYAIPVVIAQLEGLRFVFNGEGYDGVGIGYDDLITVVDVQFEGESLATVINGQIDLIIEQLQGLNAPLEDLIVSDYDRVYAIYEEVRTLVRYVKADMASGLAIELVFSDNDGD